MTRPTPTINLNAFFTALLSGGITGVLIGGIISRLSMRAVALLIGGRGEFSLGGTLGILIIGGIFGVIFGALFPLLRRHLPLPPLWQGTVYGGLWAMLVCYFFFTNREGELGLISPVIGAALFAPIPILQGAGMAWLYSGIERRMAGTPERALPISWFSALLVMLFLAVVGMGTLASNGLRLPPLITQWTSQLGVEFGRIRDLHQLLGSLFLAIWLGLSLLLFGLNSHSRRGKLTALGLLLMAGGLFHVQPPFTGMMSGIPVAPLSTAVLMGAGAAALVTVLLSFPRKPLHRWEVGLTVAVFVAVLLWNSTDLRQLPIGQPAWEWVLWGAALLTVGGAAGLALTRSWGNPPAQLPVLAWGLAVVCFLLVWVLTLLHPDLNIRGNVHPFAPLGVTLYLLPWLLPLIAMNLSAHQGLWRDI